MTAKQTKPQGRPTTKPPSVHLSVMIEADLDRALRERATADHRTRTATVEMALRAYLQP